MKLSEISRPPAILAISESGKGKTRLVGSFAQLMPTVILTADRTGLDTLEGWSWPAGEPEYILVDDWKDPWTVYDKVAELAKTKKYLAIDDLGKIQKVIERELRGHARGKDEERMRADVREKTIRQSMLEGGRRLAINQWGELDIALNSFLDEVLKLPFALTVVTVLEETRTHPRTDDIHVYPNLVGGIRDDLNARFSLVLNLFNTELKEKMVWAASCRPHPRLPNKTRYGEPRTWIDPTAPRIMRHVLRKEVTADKETDDEKAVGSGSV